MEIFYLALIAGTLLAFVSMRSMGWMAFLFVSWTAVSCMAQSGTLTLRNYGTAVDDAIATTSSSLPPSSIVGDTGSFTGDYNYNVPCVAETLYVDIKCSGVWRTLGAFTIV